MIFARLPLPPSQNHAYVNYGSGRRGPSALLKRWQKDAKTQIKRVCKKPLDKQQALFITWFWPDNRKRDMDNYLQPLQNALKSVLLKDDSWQEAPLICMYSTIDRDEARVEVIAKDLQDCPVAEWLPRSVFPQAGRGKPSSKDKRDGDTNRDKERAA